MKKLLVALWLLPIVTWANTVIFESRDENGHKVFSDTQPIDALVLRKIEMQLAAKPSNNTQNPKLSQLDKDSKKNEQLTLNNEKMANYLQAQIRMAQNQLTIAQDLLASVKKEAPLYDNGNAPSSWNAYQQSLTAYQTRVSRVEVEVMRAKMALSKAVAEASTYRQEHQYE